MRDAVVLQHEHLPITSRQTFGATGVDVVGGDVDDDVTLPRNEADLFDLTADDDGDVVVGQTPGVAHARPTGAIA